MNSLLSGLLCSLTLPGIAQQTPQTGAQQLSFAGLRSALNVQGVPVGQVNAVQVDPQGNILLLLDQKDGVRLLKTDTSASVVLAQVVIGAQGDIGLSMVLDPAGNIYVTGTSSSGALAGTAGAAFPSAIGNATNGFVAKLDAGLNPQWVSFCGASALAPAAIAATADAVFITGSIFSATLPVTASAIGQAPASGSTQNGFAERFSADGVTLNYATYLTGFNGNVMPAGIVADSSDNTYIAGATTSLGYPTVAALVPVMLGTTSGFLTKLNPAGSGLVFSTYIPGTGISSIAMDASDGNLLLSGGISLGQFPVVTVTQPLVATGYQTLVRIPLDGSTVLSSTLLAPGTQSYVTAAPGSTAWVAGNLGLALFPLQPLTDMGSGFAAHVDSLGAVDHLERFGGLPAIASTGAGAPIVLTGVAIDAGGDGLFAGSFQPSASQGLLTAETYDLPLVSAPTAAFPSTVRSAMVSPSACIGSLCSGSAAYLAKLTMAANQSAAAPALALSVDDAPNLTVRNLSSAEATAVQISVGSFSLATNCGSTLPAGAECAVELSGSGPGSITVTAANAAAQTQAIPAVATGRAILPVVFWPKELDFGIVSSISGAVTRTITVANLTSQMQTFASMLDAGARQTFPYTIAETSSDCTPVGTGMKSLSPGATCHVTLGLTASGSVANDGVVRANWLIGTRDVPLAGYAQAAQLSVSAAEVDFGTQFTGGLRLPRYLYLSNNSSVTASHAAVTLPPTSAFTVKDACPGTLEPLTVCQLRLDYQAAQTPSSDATTLTLDQGLNVLVTGTTLPQPGVNGANVNPDLSISTQAMSFATPVVVTGVSGGTQTVTLTNLGANAFSLRLALTGDYADTTDCGTSLAGHASCNVVVSFTPSQPGVRGGLLAITAGAGTSPQYVTLSGTGSGILSPANNGTIAFGGVIAGEPNILWLKVTQAFTSLTANVSGAAFGVVRVEDIGYGHGAPSIAAFAAGTTGTCFNCWLGIAFTPASAGPQIGTLSIASTAGGGSPYVLSLTGTGLPQMGFLVTPTTADFGPVAVNSVSGTQTFVVTNLIAGGGTVAVNTLAMAGDFSLTNTATGAAACGGPLPYTASCEITVAFAPVAAGPRTGLLTVQAGSTATTATLTGFGASDPGVALNPAALTFNNVPGSAATQQTITLTNTSAQTEQVGAVSAATNGGGAGAFSALSNCGTLSPRASCAVSVTFTPAAGPVTGTLNIPVTTTTAGGDVISLDQTVSLIGAYAAQSSGLQIVPSVTDFGPQQIGAAGETRQFTIGNLTNSALTLDIALPRQFVLSGAPCISIAANDSCSFSAMFLPMTNGSITGTITAVGTPGSGAAVRGLGYVEGYGQGVGMLAISGALQPGQLLSFGQVPSGQSSMQMLTLTNAASTTPLTIRRVSSQWPFLSTTTCGATMSPGANCSITLTYAPINQAAAGSNPPPTTTDTGLLTIESDAASGSDLVNMTGTSTPVLVGSPSNTAPAMTLTASPSSLSFANTAVGSAAAPQTITLTNTGTASVRVSGVQSTADFPATTNCTVLIAGASCAITVDFTPQTSAATGIRSGTVEISSNEATSLEFVSVSGASNSSTLTLSSGSLNFGTVLVGATASLPLGITNTATTSATLNSYTATGDYSIAAGTCPQAGGTLTAGAGCALQVTFSPSQSGTRTGALSIASSAAPLPLGVALAGNGAQPELQITPNALTFGPVNLGSASSLSLTLLNAGITPVSGLRFAVSGAYSITAPCGVTTLAPSASCSVTVAFSPTAAGAQAGSLTVSSSDPGSPATVSLTGMGMPAGSFTLAVNGSSSASATVTSGSPASYNLAITPVNSFTGTVVLNCTPVMPAPYATCSILPSSVVLSGAAQNSTATISTIASVAAVNQRPWAPRSGSIGDTALALLFPTLVFTWKARTSRHRAWRQTGPLAWMAVVAASLLIASGCGGGGGANPNNTGGNNLRYTPAGTYQYQVTASGTSAGMQVTQPVTLDLTVQ